MSLPTEIWDNIFLYLDYDTLERYRSLQSNYIKRLTQFNSLILAAKHGNIENIKWLFKNSLYKQVQDKILYQLSRENPRFNILHMGQLLRHIRAKAIKNGHFDTFLYLNEKQTELSRLISIKTKYPIEDHIHDPIIFDTAAQNGNIETMKWLETNNYPCGVFTFSEAVKTGNIKTMEYLLSINCPMGLLIMNVAIKTGNIETIKWLLKNGCEPSFTGFCEAIRYNHYHLLEFLKREQFILTTYCVEAAAREKNTKIIEWLFKNNCPLDVDRFGYTGLSENLDITELLYKAGFKLTESVFQTALYEGDIKTIKWLFEKECPCNKETALEYAATSGNFEVFKYIADMEFPIPDSILSDAIRGGNLKMIKYVYENYDVVLDDDAIHRSIMYSNNIDIIKWIYSIVNTRISVGRIMETGAYDFESLKWLVEHGVTCSTLVFSDFIRKNNLLAVNLLLDHGYVIE